MSKSSSVTVLSVPVPPTSASGNSVKSCVIAPPDFVKIAEAFDAFGQRVEDPDALEDGLRNGLEAVTDGRPAILDVVVG